MKFGLERFNLKGKFTWVKSNPIALGSAVLGVASLACLVAVQLMGSGFVSDVQDRAKDLEKLARFSKTPARLPARDFDQPPETRQIVVNPEAITYLEGIYKDMNGEYERIWALAVEHNGGNSTRRKHLPLLEGLFPDPGADLYKLYDAKAEYLRCFDEMFGPYSESARNPRMHAGVPVPDADMTDEVKRVTENFLANSLTAKSLNELSLAEQERLESSLRNAKLQLLKRRAESIHVYAQPERGGKDYPFQIDGWATDIKQPPIEVVWEGQMGLWIQQDIVDAIGRCNGVADPKLNVVVAPIKRIISIKPVAGYIGVNPAGAQSGDVTLPNDFAASPSGRKSNVLYDVRHVNVDMVVDYQQLPKVFDALAQSNFITVLTMQVEDKDPYQALREGFYYGSGDTVEVKMLLETIWLRTWTSRLMPAAVRKQLGVPDDITAGGPATPAPAKTGD